MVSTNPMFRNTPTNQERNKMRNSGMDLNAVRDITGRTSDFRTPNASFNPLDRAGQLQRGAADDYAAERMAGGTGAAPMDRVNQLQPLAFAEDNTTFVDGKAYSRGLGEGSPQPTAQPGGYRARMAPKEPDPFAPGAGYQATDPSDPYYSKRPRKPMRLAEGGPVEGPGGPKDDLINAKLSDGEFVMPSEVVEFYGLDRLHKMMAKAKEGLNEIKPAPQALPTPLPVTMPQPTPAFAYGGMAQSMPVPGYAEGGLMEVDDAVARQQIAADYNQNPSFLDYYFPEFGFKVSETASSATQQANDALGSFFDSQNAMDQQSREAGLAQQKRIRDMELMNDPNWQQANPGLYKYQAEQLAQSMGPMAGPQRLTAVVGDQAYGPTMTDSPAFQPMMAPSPAAPMTFDPAAVAAMRSRRADLRAQPAPAPALANGRQPAPVLSSPMDVPLMRPAPLTMTEKEQQAKPMSRSRTPESNPEFEAALAGLTGMQKRRARAGLQMEEATNQRNQGRADIAQAEVDARNERIRVQNLQDTRDNYRIQHQFAQARFNEQFGANAALNAAKDKEAEDKAKQQAEENRRFRPVLDDQGNPIPGRMMNTQGQQLNLQTESTPGITMMPVPGTQGQVIPMMGGSRVPGMPVMQAQTQPGPFREGLGRTTYTPVPDAATAPKVPTVRKTEPMKGATADAPQWDYASLSDGSTRPITIDNPFPAQTRDRYMHQYGRAPQTQEEWTEAWYLTTGQPRPTAGAAQPTAGTAPATRAKIKSITPVT